MVQWDQIFCDKTFAEVTLGNQIVQKVTSEGVNE